MLNNLNSKHPTLKKKCLAQFLFLTLGGATSLRKTEKLRGKVCGIRHQITAKNMKPPTKVISVLPFLRTDYIRVMSKLRERCGREQQNTETCSSYPDGSSDRSDDELPGRLALWLPVARFSFCFSGLLLILCVPVLQRLLWRVEGVRELYVPLVESDLLPLEVRFLVQHPSKFKKKTNNTHINILYIHKLNKCI